MHELMEQKTFLFISSVSYQNDTIYLLIHCDLESLDMFRGPIHTVIVTKENNKESKSRTARD